MRPKPVQQAHFHRRHRSPQASARAGIRTHVAPRASAGRMCPKPAPQAHFRRRHRSPQASAQAGTRTRTSRHERSSPHSHPARPRSEARAASRTKAPQNSAVRTHPCEFGLHRRVLTPRVSAGHTPKARAASTFLSQALQPAGFSASRDPHACRATRVSAGHAPEACAASAFSL